MTEDEMSGWHHRLDGHEFEQTPGAGVQQMLNKYLTINKSSDKVVAEGLQMMKCFVQGFL